MIIAEEIVLPGVVVKELEADFVEVVLGGLLGSDPVETI